MLLFPWLQMGSGVFVAPSGGAAGSERTKWVTPFAMTATPQWGDAVLVAPAVIVTK